MGENIGFDFNNEAFISIKVILTTRINCIDIFICMLYTTVRKTADFDFKNPAFKRINLGTTKFILITTNYRFNTACVTGQIGEMFRF